jgi:predicted enzyme related to lactoylglutathione lyase
MAFFRSNERTVGGAICTGKGYRPTTNGTVFYLNGGNDLNVFLGKVKSLGGKPVDSPMHMAEIGSFAYFLDTEGNKLGVRSKK